jgi:transcriptional regulator with XRE-family HTH domain
MKNTDSFDNRDRLIRLGLNIGLLRKLRGLTQEELAEKAGISRSFLSAIEAPNLVQSFSLEILYNISDALTIDPKDLISGNILENKPE